MTVYVRAARALNPPSIAQRGGEITGTVLHLGTFQLEDPLTTAVPLGTWLPLCGGRQFVRPVERWAITAPGHRGWAGHAHWPLCRRCAKALTNLWVAAADQHARYTAHQEAAAAAATPIPERTNPDA